MTAQIRHDQGAVMGERFDQRGPEAAVAAPPVHQDQGLSTPKSPVTQRPVAQGGDAVRDPCPSVSGRHGW